MEHNETERATVIARGVIHGHEAGGEVVLERTPQGDVLRLKDYWIAPGAPDVRVYLSPDVAGDPEVEGAVDFGKITTFSGDASYPIPGEVSIEDMRSLVVYCKVYSVSFGVAVLERA